MVGGILKALGITVLVCGILGTVIGVGLVLFGQGEVNESNDGLLFTDSGRREAGEQATGAGATLVGLSLFGAGLGLVLLVAGIVVGGRERGQQQQQQQVVVLTGAQPPVFQGQQRPPLS